jgi:hypothetical protein
MTELKPDEVSRRVMEVEELIRTTTTTARLWCRSCTPEE